MMKTPITVVMIPDHYPHLTTLSFENKSQTKKM